ncbi:bifunctional DNA primase/polymerase [Micromonospora sp. CPCC 206061]|uniref:bifunctional DNA primase/polymerase n=1 Tax=Micromonospora sp. CPCC 206061 TaxID=3122410 RepID=UPI002FF2B819
MRWSPRPPFVHPSAPRARGLQLTLDRTRLRRAAMRYAEHGWDVTPGACFAGERFDCARPGCPTMGCHPALERWEEAASADCAQVAAWWRQQPHAVLLPTGRAFDVLEVSAHLGLRVLGAARLYAGVVGPGRGQVRGPVAVTPTGRWMFLVRPGDPLRPELDDSLVVVRHGPGSWIPAPPTRLPEGPVRWSVSPQETCWLLPDSYAVQGMLVDALHAAAATRGPGLPRQTSTLRRAA